MLRYMTAHPTAANLLMVLMILAGLFTLPSLNRETFPEVEHFEVQISVPYPGATPSDVELGICKPLEDALDGISFTDEKRCQARSGIGLMTMKMLEDGDFAQFKDDINSAVDSIDNFPANSETAIVEELGRTQKVVTLALTADLPRPQLKTLAEQLKQRMTQTGTIPLVEIEGFSQRELQVHVPQHNLRKYGLSLQDIADRLAQQDLDVPAGKVTTSDTEYQIRFNDERRTARELAEVVILQGEQAGEVRLGEIATVRDSFTDADNKILFNGVPAAFLVISKNSGDDSLRVLEATKAFIAEEQRHLPAEVALQLTEDSTSIVSDRLRLLGENAWQGLLLVFIVMWLFFGTRYAFWVMMGLPVSFLASTLVFNYLGVSINMLSMVALLLALGILMDDAIVISESIGAQIRKGKQPLQAAIDGTQQVARGVFSSFLTTLCVFSGLLVMEGNIGQVLVVIPIVLLSVIVVSLVEAFFILPSHLYHSLNHQQSQQPSRFHQRFDHWFEGVRGGMDRLVSRLIRIRYAFVGGVIALLIVSIGLMASGVLRFSAFPAVEGDQLQARLIMPSGTPLAKTEQLVAKLEQQLRKAAAPLNDRQPQPAIENVAVKYGQNKDAFETGPHLATINVDLLTAEQRNYSLKELKQAWQQAASTLPEPWQVVIAEPSLALAGRPIEIQLRGDDLDRLADASWQLQHWLAGYPGVNNLMDDLRPGLPEFSLTLKEGAYSLGLNAQLIATQLRAAYQGAKASELNIGAENYEVIVELDNVSRSDLATFETFPIIHPQTGASVPLSTVAEITPIRGYSRIHRVDNQRTVTVLGDVDSRQNNVVAIMADLQKQYLPELQRQFPEIDISLKGEIEEGAKTQNSLKRAMLFALIGVFVLLSFQFRSYIEPVIVMINIPLALIGVIWGHWLMGLDLTMPSMMGFVSLAGIVVNDSILLVEFVKQRMAQGLSIHEAAAKASHDRFRAVLLTSLTTIAGMTPLLFETSLQAQILIPLATSIIFGIASSTLLVLFVVPCLYTILEDFRGEKGAVNAEANKA